MRFQLEIDSVNKSFDGKVILSDIYLKCEIGDIIGVFGRNGSGKSTFLKILFGTVNAENKFIRLNNKVINKTFIVENGVSYLPQDNFLPNNFSVKKVINLMIKNRKIDFLNDEIIKQIIDLKVNNLSGGELKYLQVKLLLFNESKFCLLDEPFSGVSPLISNLICEQIKEESKSKGIIVTDHNYSYVLEIASKIFVINNGFGKILQNRKELIKYGYFKSNSVHE